MKVGDLVRWKRFDEAEYEALDDEYNDFGVIVLTSGNCPILTKLLLASCSLKLALYGVTLKALT